MAFSHSHKTVVVLDHSPYFLSSSQQFVDFDIFTKNRAQGFIPLAPIAKSMWTCNVEAAVEYGRLVYDLFPLNKLINVISSDVEAHVLGSWIQADQSLNQLMTVLAHHGPPQNKAGTGDCSVMHGLSQAIEILCQPTETQHQLRILNNADAGAVINRGSIICLTSLTSDNHVNMLEACVQDALSEHNKLVSSTDTLLPLSHCDLYLVHVVPVGSESSITHKAYREISSQLATEIHVSQSGRHISVKMVELSMKQFDLASTTVTGIPMKEEQNASSSANYDVELLHSSKAHREFLNSGHLEGLVIPSKEGLNSSTITLKWCTPKSNAMGELQQCTSVHRITPVDVNSRPSSCLTNFLLNGRSVMLEQPRKSGARIISHILASHGGEIFIHTLATTRSKLEDPPSISEGCGGRVTDYRINDFGELMKFCRPAPVADTSHLSETPLERQKAKIERLTRYWPMVIGDTIIFNLMSAQYDLETFPEIIVKETMSDEEVLECKKAIFKVVGIESKNEPLPVSTSGSRGKGPKRDEQYRQMWNELEKFLRVHSNNSPNHEKVLECLLECRKPSEEARLSSTSPRKSTSGAETSKAAVKDEKPEKNELEKSLQEYEKFSKMTEREKLEMNKAEVKASDSPPPVSKKAKLGWDLGKSSSGNPQSLLSLWTTRIDTIHNQKRQEFAGRLESSGNKAELYIHMKEENGGTNEGNTAPGKK